MPDSSKKHRQKTKYRRFVFRKGLMEELLKFYESLDFRNLTSGNIRESAFLLF